MDNPLYELLRLEVSVGEEHDPTLLHTAKIANKAVKDFLNNLLHWAELLEILEFLEIDPIQYETDVKANFVDRGLPWF